MISLQVSTGGRCCFNIDTFSKATRFLGVHIRQKTLGGVLGSTCGRKEHGLGIANLPFLAHAIHVICEIGHSVAGQHVPVEVSQESLHIAKGRFLGIVNLDADQILSAAKSNVLVVRKKNIEEVGLVVCDGMQNGVPSNGRDINALVLSQFGPTIGQGSIHIVERILAPAGNLKSVVANTNRGTLDEAVIIANSGADMNGQIGNSVEVGNMEEVEITAARRLS